jgi:hypothetical protein
LLPQQTAANLTVGSLDLHPRTFKDYSEKGLYRFSLYSLLFCSHERRVTPISPFIHLSIGTYSSGANGLVLLTSQFMTDREIIEAVDQVKSEIKEFRHKVQKEFKNIHAKM